MSRSDPYATWDQAIWADKVTDDPDGWPDGGIVPLVEALRAGGFVTLQSCAGHLGSNDGHLWIADGPRVEGCIERLLAERASHLAYVRLTRHPERRWEIYWHPGKLHDAVSSISHAFGTAPVRAA